MEEREHVQDMEDAQLREDEEAYLEMREQEDWRQGQVFLQEVQQRRSKREAEGVVRGIYIYDTCWWYSLCNVQYRQHYENTCSYNVDC